MADDTETGMTCPRRIEQGRHYEDSPFRGSGSGLDRWREDGTCSYCGSLDPDILMARLEAGDVELGPTDKSYKVYVDNRGGPMFKTQYRKNCDMRQPGSKCTGPDDCVHWVIEETQHAKFYFQHFGMHQMERFIELNNAGKLNIGYPGHFYVLPFFCRRGE